MRIRAPSFRIGSSFDVAFSPSGDILASLSTSVDLWDVNKRQRIHKFKTLSHVNAVCFSFSSDSIAVKNTSGTIVVSSLQGDTRFKIPRDDDEGCGVLFSPDDAYIIDGSWKGVLSVTDIQTGIQVYQETYPYAMILDLRFSSAAQQFAWIVSQKLVSPETPKEKIVVAPWPFSSNKFMEIPLQANRASTLTFDPTGKYIAVVRDDYFLDIFDVLNGAIIESTKLSRRCHAVAWSPDERNILITDRDGVTVLNYPSLGIAYRINLPYAYSVAYTPNGKTLAIGSWQKGLVLDRQDLASYNQE